MEEYLEAKSIEVERVPQRDLDGRQLRELEYHRGWACCHANRIDQPVADDVLRSSSRRPWNATWCAYDALIQANLAGKRILIPGCGFGDDAIRLAKLGAEVYASDLSEELLRIARTRARRAGTDRIRFDAMAVESLAYADHTLDGVFFNDILHHVDIGGALAETRRVLKPGALVVVNELYTHSAIQRVRQSALVNRLIYPRMVRFIYGTDRPYITADERKIDERELAAIEAVVDSHRTLNFFLLLEGRLFPSRWPRLSRLDHRLLRTFEPVGRSLAGRFVLIGRLN